MKEKCVVYVRVSTDLQDYKRQIHELTNFASDSNYLIPKDGVFKDNLSGFKDERERPGLKYMMNYCTKHQIKRVLVWEISRLARKQSTLHTLKDFFIKHQINVYFKNQNRWLLNDKNELSGEASLMISMLGWHAEYESALMKDRFRSRKKLNEEQGKYNGGKIPFGYTIDKDNFYVINSKPIDGLGISESDIVKEMFRLYADGLVCSQICRLNRSKNYPKIVCNTHTLARLLRNTSYIGYKKTGYSKRPTPAIIEDYLFKNVQDLIDTNKTKADKGKKHIYLLRGIIKCSHCGEYYVGKQTDDAYICPKNSGSNKTNKKSFCKGGNISISNIDGILWERTKYWLTKKKINGFEDDNEIIKTDIEELKEQIIRYQDLIKKVDKNKKKTNQIFKADGYTYDEYKKELKQIIKEKENFEYEISLLQSKIDLFKKQLKELNSFDTRIKSINSITDRNQMKAIMKSLLKEVTFLKYDASKTIILVKYYRLRYLECIIYNPFSKKGNFFKVINTKYMRYDSDDKVFYAIKEAEKVTEHTSSSAITEKVKGLQLPQYITLYDFVQFKEKYNLDVKIKDTVIYPIPTKENSVYFDFDGLFNAPDSIGFATKHEYKKIEYFKDLKRSRFNRN